MEHRNTTTEITTANRAHCNCALAKCKPSAFAFQTAVLQLDSRTLVIKEGRSGTGVATHILLTPWTTVFTMTDLYVALFVLGLATMGLLFLFLLGCEKV